MNSAELAVDISGLRKTYRQGWFGGTFEALKGVDLRVPKGQIFGLLGPNGAGKTTIIKILLGIVRSSGGKASLLGRPAGKPLGRRRVGYLPENLQLPPHQTARTALEFYGRLSGLDHGTIRKRGTELLDRVGLSGRENESVQQFSKGMRQRLGFAQALLHDPELLILDEPTDGLDPVGRAEVREIMEQLGAEGRTVFINSHLLQEVEMICGHAAILDRGELKFAGSLADFDRDGSDSTQAERDVELQLSGDSELARQCFPADQIAQWQVHGQRIQATIHAPEQTVIDQAVDLLRRQGISIIHLARRKKSLEDFFLSLVNS